MAVPGRNPFSLRDVADAVYESGANYPIGCSLSTCFSHSLASQFDPYYGSANMNPKTLLGFKNYGHNYYYLYSTSLIFNENIAPLGCHIPDQDEISYLIDYLGGAPIVGPKLKQAGTTNWAAPNALATNSSGFTAIGGGVFYNGKIINIGLYYTMWFKPVIDFFGGAKNILSLGYNRNDVVTDWRDTYTSSMYKHSIRCLKNDTNAYPSIYDGDGNLYQTVLIGNQRWLLEDLHTSRYNDGTLIQPEHYARYYKQFFS